MRILGTLTRNGICIVQNLGTISASNVAGAYRRPEVMAAMNRDCRIHVVTEDEADELISSIRIANQVISLAKLSVAVRQPELTTGILQ